MNDNTTINHLKALVINGVDKASSGHPGGALSSMDFAYILFKEYLRFDPKDPNWFGRDRFILSAGHESMLLYSLLFGVGWLEKQDLSQFRSFSSRTPGHPENHVTPGVECTTGPLGQGAAMSVGFAVASQHLSSKFKTELFSNRVYALLGDGCMQEEVVSGAASYAGHLGLKNLVWYYDKNNQQISGPIDRTVSCDYRKIFEGFSWDVIEIDGHSHTEIREALEMSKGKREKPLLIIGESIMAKGLATMEGSHKTHGAPLSQEERQLTLKKLGVSNSEDFSWPEEVKSQFQTNFSEKAKEASLWRSSLEELMEGDANFKKMYAQYFNSSVEDLLPEALSWKQTDKIATRNVFGKLIEHWSNQLPQLVGGSADLEPSNMTEDFAKKVSDFSKDNPHGRNFSFGVREFTMSCVTNGLALHGGLIPFDATFLTFSDYSRPAIRLGSLQKARVVHEFTHDSFYLGEDGPTHQPIEHLMSLRSIPGLYVFRPCDAYETETNLRQALSLKAPSCLCLSRQKLPMLNLSKKKLKEASRGGWVVYGPETGAKLIIFASGAEVHLAIEVAEAAEKEFGLSDKVKVVALNCFEIFEEQEKVYQDKVLDHDCKNRVSIEAGSTLGWERYIGRSGLTIGVDHFGASAPASRLAEEFGFTKSAIIDRLRNHLS